MKSRKLPVNHKYFRVHAQKLSRHAKAFRSAMLTRWRTISASVLHLRLLHLFTCTCTFRSYLWVVLLVTHGDSASCFMQLHMNWERTSFRWKILPVQNILIVPICQKCFLKKNTFHDFFIIFIVVTHGDFCYHFLCCSNKYCFSYFVWMFFSNLTFDGCLPINHLMT